VKTAAPMLAALMLSVGIAGTANAAVVTLKEGDLISFDGIEKKGSFTDQFSFNLASDSLVDGLFLNRLLNKVSLSFKAVTDSVWTPIQSGITPNSFTSFSLGGTPLHSGDYLFQIAGVGLGSLGFQRHFVGALAIAPVPEPETWAMLCVGAILIGYQLRRSRKTLAPSLPLMA